MSLVPIIMGSRSDLKHGQETACELTKYGIASEIRVASAHQVPAYVLELLAAYEADPQPKVYIAVAGRVGSRVQCQRAHPLPRHALSRDIGARAIVG